MSHVLLSVGRKRLGATRLGFGVIFKLIRNVTADVCLFLFRGLGRCLRRFRGIGRSWLVHESNDAEQNCEE